MTLTGLKLQCIALVLFGSLVGASARAASETVLYSFEGEKDGANPPAGLLAGADGILYGATALGGASNAGTVFKLVPPAAGKTNWTKTVLYSFPSGNSSNPAGSLIADRDGNLYGTAVGILGSSSGFIFKVARPAAGKPSWTGTIIYKFPLFRNSEWYPDGGIPSGSLILDASGNLYGTTLSGGGANGGRGCDNFGCGTVFKLTPPAAGKAQWSETVLCNFANFSRSTDNAGPEGGLIADAKGNLYGATLDVSASDRGMVFELKRPTSALTAWTETPLYTFTYNSVTNSETGGVAPYGKLLADQTGNLYGTTSFGGKFLYGVVFKLSRPATGKTTWTETVLHSFSGGKDGLGPMGGLIADARGNLYGTTAGSGIGAEGPANYGTVFKLSPPAAGKTAWTETVLHDFTGLKDGGGPGGELIIDAGGNLYGTTSIGGAFGHGTVFKVTP